jgi:hypothetical protein
MPDLMVNLRDKALLTVAETGERFRSRRMENWRGVN